MFFCKKNIKKALETLCLRAEKNLFILSLLLEFCGNHFFHFFFKKEFFMLKRWLQIINP